MSHTIKLEDRIYDKLERFRGKRETFSQAVERLLVAGEKFLEVYQELVGRQNSQEGDHEHR